MWFSFDNSINVVQILTIIGLFLGGLRLIAKVVAQASIVKSDVKQIGLRLDRMDEELKRQTDILISLGRQDERIRVVEIQLANLISNLTRERT